MKLLAKIAYRLRKQAEFKGQARHTLARGLTLTLTKTGNESHGEAAHWRLSLTREKVYPSELERLICRRAFNVPAGAVETSLSDRTYRIHRFTWTEEAPQVKQAAMQLTDTRAGYYTEGM